MVFYITIWLILLICSKINSKYLFWVCVLLLIFVAGLRNVSVGTDTETYYIACFSGYEKGYSNSYLEPGWLFINKLVASLGYKYNVLLFCASLLTMLPLGILFQKSTKNPILALFVFYSCYGFFFSLNAMRQFIAIGWTMLGFYYLNKNKNIAFLLLVALAFLFHHSALFVLFAYVFRLFDMKKSMFIYLALFVSLIIGVVLPIESLNNYMFLYGGYLDRLRNGQTLIFSIILTIYTTIGFLIVFCNLKINEKNSLWIKLYFFAVIVGNIFLKLQYSVRFVHYFFFTQCIVVPMLFYSLKNNKNRQIVCGVEIIYLFGFLFGYLLNNSADVIPYEIY